MTTNVPKARVALVAAAVPRRTELVRQGAAVGGPSNHGPASLIDQAIASLVGPVPKPRR